MKLISSQNKEDLIELIKKLKERGISSSQYWFFIKRFLELKARKERIPITGLFELTPYCNLDCKMCYVHLTSDQFYSSSLLDLDVWKSLAFQAFNAGMREVRLTGGECLLYPDFDDLYLYLYSKGVRIGIASNGLLIDRNRINFFKQYPPKSIQISLYGDSDETYEKVTGYRCFEQVRSNILSLKNANLPVKIAITPNPYLYDSLSNTLSIVESFGIPYNVNARLISPRSNTGRFGEDLTTSQYVEVFKILNRIKKHTLTPLEEDLEEMHIECNDHAPIHGLQCGAGRSSFAILYDGKMALCASLSEYTANPLEEGFMASWNKIVSLADNYLLPVECGACKYKSHCMICVASHKNATLPGHCDSRICERTREYIKAGIIPLD